MLQGQEVRTVLDAKGYIELDDSMMIVYGIIPTGRVKIRGRLEIEHSGRYMLVDSVDFGNNKKVIYGYTDTHAYFTLPLELGNIKVLSYDENYKRVTSGEIEG